MKPLSSPSPHHDGSPVVCSVLAHGVVRATEEALATLRRKPGPPPGEPLPTGFLKHTDDQTVSGLAAVFQACQQGLAGTNFKDWAVLSAPRFLGRGTVARSMERFKDEGAWGVSPHIIPHCSLHSISGTVSQALKAHGPNFGVGGGPDGVAKAMLAAAALVGCQALPGVWVIITGWSREPGLEDKQPFLTEAERTAGICSAVALALGPARPEDDGLRLVISPAAVVTDSDGVAPLRLEALCDALSAETVRAHSWRLGCGGCIEIKQVSQRSKRTDLAA